MKIEPVSNRQEGNQRPYKLAHQTLVLTAINFESQTIVGYVELVIYPLRPDLRHVKLNCKQCRIFRVCINELWEVDYLYNDPTLMICPDGCTQRDLHYFTKAHVKAIMSVEADTADGELTVNLPSEISTAIAELRPVRICIEYALEQPKGGVQFVVADLPGTLKERSAHMFTYGVENSARLWFPCVDAFSEPCTWKLEFTVDLDMVAVSCGDLLEVIYTPDMNHKTYHYYLSSPTAAPNIALAVGPFEALVDPNMHEVTHFCLPGLMPVLKHTTATLHEAFEFYEELMSSRFPYSCYKQVFVDQAYQDASPYATISIFSTNILHSARIIDQAPESRKLMASSVAHQFFGCFLAQLSWYDTWLVKGITGFLTALYIKKFFGNNEYRYFIMKEMKDVCDYEQRVGGIILNPRFTDNRLHFPLIHPHVISPQYMNIFCKKAHLVMRILETHVGLEHLLQALNKLLSLATTASLQTFIYNTWTNMLISNTSFLKVMATVTGKDIKPLITLWVSQSGCARFTGNFVFIRKRNVVELEIKQDQNTRGALKYAGPLNVVIQELDGSFKRVFNIEENKTKFEITCHSKSRRNKKKKIPLMTGEEVDMDLSAMDPDSPVLWLRLDPDMLLLRDISLEQPDYMWQFELRYERDVVAQSEAILALESFSTPATRLALTDTLENDRCFYRVRIDVCHCLAKVANQMAGSWAGPPAMMMIFRKMFGSNSCPSIIRQNNFTNLQHYFLLKTIPVTMAQLRTPQNICPPDVFRFLLDLFKYNDNNKNKLSDNYYRACLIDAFATTITPAVTMVAVTNVGADVESLSSDTRLVLEEITRYLNLEKLLPSYRHNITVSCLKAIRVMQRFGHLPSDSSVFRSYAQFGVFQDIRVAAIEVLIDLIKTEKKVDELNWLLEFVSSEKVPFVQHSVYRLLAQNPPFIKNSHPLNTVDLVETLWKTMTRGLSYDHRVRCDVTDLYNTLYGNVHPTCLPIPESVMPLNTKERKPSKNSSATPEPIIDVNKTLAPAEPSMHSIVPISINEEVIETEMVVDEINLDHTTKKPAEEKTLKRKASQTLMAVAPNLESSMQLDLWAQPIKSEESGSFKLTIRLGSSENSQDDSPEVTMTTTSVPIKSESAMISAPSDKHLKPDPDVVPQDKPSTEARPLIRVASWTEGTSHLSEEDSSSPVNSPRTTSPTAQTLTAPQHPIPKLSFEGLIPKRISSTEGASLLTQTLTSCTFPPVAKETASRADDSSCSPHRTSLKKKKKKEKHKHKHKHKRRHEHHRRHDDRDTGRS